MILAGNLHFMEDGHILSHISLWLSYDIPEKIDIIPYYPIFLYVLWYPILMWPKKKNNWLLVIRQMSEASRRSSSPASPAPSGALKGSVAVVPRAVAVGFSKYLYIYKRQYIDIHRFQSRKRGIKDFHQDVGHCVPQWSFQYFKRQGIAGLQIQLQ